MKDLYKVKVNEDHKARPDQVVDGYLGNSLGDGKIAAYSEIVAYKKAFQFGGTVEFSHMDDGSRYFLFGSRATDICDSEDMSILVNEIKSGLDYGLHKFDPNSANPSEELLMAYDGWGNWVDITEEEYEILRSI